MRSVLSCLLILFFACTPLIAQPDVQVGKIDPIKVIWGPQIIYAEVTSSVDYPKFLSASVHIQFNGRYLHPKRAYRTNFLLEPAGTVAMPINLEIPPNFGEANITVELYDVVDTLDPYFPDQKLTEQRSRLVFAVPDELFSYMQERITMPPFADNSPLFDTEVARLAFLLFREGKEDREIARMAKIDSVYLRQIIWKWKYYNFLLETAQDTTLRPTFPIISTAEAEELKPVADKLSEKLSSLIQKNMKGYLKVRDSLVAAGKVNEGDNNVLNPGTLINRPYPMVTAMMLWYSLGRGFIAGTQGIDFYNDTDPCNVHIPLWMYAVRGGDLFNGYQYASFSIDQGSPLVVFADTIPVVKCPELYPYIDRLQPNDWQYAPDGGPEFCALDTSLAHPVLRALSVGTDKILQPAYGELQRIVEKHEPGSFVPGVRWWFWNLVATRTTEILVKNGTITRFGNGHYRMEVIKR
ncbi:MAG: hypothetical protein IPH75_15935 [bacterium]|nr:hypothetical protein [bacterium]